VPAAADGVSRSSQYGQQCADDKEDDTEDEEQMGEGEGGDEAGEEEPENDENDSETDHDMYLISAGLREEDGRAVMEGVIGVGPQAIWYRLARSARLDLRDPAVRKTCSSDPIDCLILVVRRERTLNESGGITAKLSPYRL
jgi:hypothetical protein